MDTHLTSEVDLDPEIEIEPSQIATPSIPIAPNNVPEASSSITLDNHLVAELLSQLIKERTSSSTRGDSSSVDTYLKTFQAMRPTRFGGATDPTQAEDWLREIEKIFNGMVCPDNRKVPLATYALTGEAERWWERQMDEKFKGLPQTEILWVDFTSLFRNWFVPLSARKCMQGRFLRLVQGPHTIAEYESEFTRLSRYASHLIPDEAEKCDRFLSGLRDDIQSPLIPLAIEDYSILVERARRIEQNLLSRQLNRNDFKRNETFRNGGQNPFKSKVPVWKKQKMLQGTNSNIPSNFCSKCKKIHNGECLAGMQICYRCKQPGHIATQCTAFITRNQNGKRPQQNTGRPVQFKSNPSTSTPLPNRSNPQPRIYTLSQDKAKKSEDVITGTIFIGNIPNKVLFDTGASHSFISSRTIEANSLAISPMLEPLSIKLPNDTFIHANYISTVKLSIGDKEINTKLIVMPLSEYDIILGMDWLSSNAIIIDCAKKFIIMHLPGKAPFSLFRDL